MGDLAAPRHQVAEAGEPAGVEVALVDEAVDAVQAGGIEAEAGGGGGVGLLTHVDMSPACDRCRKPRSG